jgi:membrane protein DedA with SNARE-associated domain
VGVWGRLAGVLFGLLNRYDDAAVFVLVLIEEAGVPLPLPGDLVMVVAGFRVARGEMNLFVTIFLLELATLVGSSFLYWLAARGGRPLLYRYGRFIHLERNKLDKAEGWVKRHGALAIVLGRIIPGLRMPTAIAAGVFGIRYTVFLPAVAVGSTMYILFFVLLGYFAGPEALSVLHDPRLSLRAGLSIVLFLGMGVFLIVMYRRSARIRNIPRVPESKARRLETATMAGFLATLEMGLGTNGMLYLFSLLGFHGAEPPLIRLATRGADRYFDGDLFNFTVAITAGLFVSGILWAIVYAYVADPALPGPSWLRGVTFSVVPLLASLLVLLPLLGGGFFGLLLRDGWLPAAGELLRNALFGLGLGTSYTLLRIARQGPARMASTSPPPESDSFDAGSTVPTSSAGHS